MTLLPAAIAGTCTELADCKDGRRDLQEGEGDLSAGSVESNATICHTTHPMVTRPTHATCTAASEASTSTAATQINGPSPRKNSTNNRICRLHVFKWSFSRAICSIHGE